MKILLKPIDTLFFRDGKPFTMGTETWADGVMLPNPSVIYGALKTAYYSNNLDEFELVTTNIDPAAEVINIESIYYKYNNNNYYPLPLDLVYLKNKKKSEKFKEEKKNKFKVTLENKKTSRNLTSVGNFEIYINDQEVEVIDNSLIDEKEIFGYLMGNYKVANARKLSQIVSSEPKVGIGRNNLTHTTDEGKLYRVGMNRFDNFYFGIELENDIEIKNIYPKLGGEGKIISIKEDNDNLKITDINSIEINNKFKIYLSTPAIFEKGWLPNWIDENTHIGKINGLKVKLISAFIGKPISVGGFDMAKNAPKAMKKAVPAGSVYYFELLEGTKEMLIEAFHKKSFSEFNTNKQGFGITYLGTIL